MNKDNIFKYIINKIPAESLTDETLLKINNFISGMTVDILKEQIANASQEDLDSIVAILSKPKALVAEESNPQ